MLVDHFRQAAFVRRTRFESLEATKGTKSTRGQVKSIVLFVPFCG